MIVGKPDVEVYEADKEVGLRFWIKDELVAVLEFNPLAAQRIAALMRSYAHKAMGFDFRGHLPITMN